MGTGESLGFPEVELTGLAGGRFNLEEWNEWNCLRDFWSEHPEMGKMLGKEWGAGGSPGFSLGHERLEIVSHSGYQVAGDMPVDPRMPRAEGEIQARPSEDLAPRLGWANSLFLSVRPQAGH